VARPALTIGVAVQPEVLRALAETPEFRGLGILARFLYSLPVSPMGSRRPDAEPVPPDLSHDYAAQLCTLTRSLDAVGANGQVICFAPGSAELLTEFAARLEHGSARMATCTTLADWAGKLAGAIARVAALVHLGRNVRGPWGREVPPTAVEAAISVGDYAIAHAQAVFAAMGADPEVELARRVLRWIRDRDLAEFSRRDAFRDLQSTSTPKVTDLDPALELLVAHEYIAPVPAVRGSSGGRPPSPRFRVNPYGQNRQNRHNPEGEGGSVGSVGSVPKAART
jgi:replicative DNA helicase